MNKKAAILSPAIMLTTILFLSLCLTLPKAVKAQPNEVSVEGMSYNVNSSLADNLKTLTGKRVYVTLDSGKTLSGSVKNVGDHLLHLEKLAGKEYFDALIRIENISAIDAKFRDYQR